MNITNDNYPATDNNLRIIKCEFKDCVKYRIEYRKFKLKRSLPLQWIPTEDWGDYCIEESHYNHVFCEVPEFTTIENARDEINRRKQQYLDLNRKNELPLKTTIVG